ncbi:MAG: hypothetical protein GYA23_05925, partial [Methanomicrobiales archaeon]|nr:hypothetical protein [Methanomicrobiales archaeon]
MYAGTIMGREQDCLQCGVCCEKWGWDQKGIPQDLVPWIAGRRDDILQHVWIRFRDGTVRTGRGLGMQDLTHIERIYYWVSPSGNKLTSCPFYDKRDDGKVYC